MILFLKFLNNIVLDSFDILLIDWVNIREIFKIVYDNV